MMGHRTEGGLGSSEAMIRGDGGQWGGSRLCQLQELSEDWLLDLGNRK